MRKAKKKQLKHQRRMKNQEVKTSEKQTCFISEKYPISDLEFTMGTTKYLPNKEDCKADKRYSQIAADLFFKGCSGCPQELITKENVNWKVAMYVVFAHLKSFDPSHEHKMLGCGELLSYFFDIKEV